MTKQRYDLEERLLEFSVRIIKIVEQLPNVRTGNHVADQLLRSGTSPYPNHGEAQAAESPKDFIHKLRISLLDVCFSFDVGCSMFDVHLSKQLSTYALPSPSRGRVREGMQKGIS